jgi:tripartite-type tricarboxylate transporter receptor subunit TctC
VIEKRLTAIVVCVCMTVKQQGPGKLRPVDRAAGGGYIRDWRPMTFKIPVPVKIVPVPLLAVVLALAAPCVLAQPYPYKPIRVIVPVTAGGPTDVIARMIGQKIAEAWGQAVVVDNRPGAGGTIGDAVAAKAAPDGYTLAFVGMHFIIAPMLHANAGYDPIRDFAPIILAAISPVMISAHPSLPARNVHELTLYAKSNAVSYVSPGRGTAGHLAGELFGISTGVRLEPIQYKGAAPAMNDLLGGHVKLGFTALPQASPHVKAGRLRALAVTTLARTASLPDVPTVAEAGYPGFSADNMSGVVAPRGTPRPIVDKLNREIARITNMPDMKGQLTSLGFDPAGNTPDEFGRYLRAEVAKWTKVIQVTGLRAE